VRPYNQRQPASRGNLRLYLTALPQSANTHPDLKIWISQGARRESCQMQMTPSKGQLHIGARIRKRCMLKARKVITPGKETVRQFLTSASTTSDNASAGPEILLASGGEIPNPLQWRFKG